MGPGGFDPFASRLARALVMAAGLPSAGCASAPVDEAVAPMAGLAPVGSSSGSPQAAASASELPAQPTALWWWADAEHLCMQPAATNRTVLVDARSRCGEGPDSLVRQQDNCPTCGHEFDADVTRVEAQRRGSACCYRRVARPKAPSLRVGRPLRSTGAGLVVAEQTTSGAWGVPLTVSAPSASAAQGWASDALLEHASAAELTRLALELAGLGAPSSLVRASLVAAAQEVRHARLCASLAEAYGGGALGTVGFGRLDLARSRPLARSAAELAERLLSDGCVGESVGAVVAAVGAADARARGEPDVARVLEIIAADEAEHAVLSMRALRRCLAVASSRERGRIMASVERVLASPLAFDALVGEGAPGRLTEGELARVVRRALAELVAPALHQLLTADETCTRASGPLLA
jgi:hypothetical protein